MDPNARSTLACPHCGHDNNAEAKFCNRCGARIDGACPQCGVENPPGSRFCNSCGRPLGNEQTGPAPNGSPARLEPGTPSSPGLGAACPRCQQRNEPDSLYCYNCGLPLRGEPGFSGPASGAGAPVGVPAFAIGQPGGFWMRFVAYVIDGIVILGIMAITVPAFLGTGLVEYMERASTGTIQLYDLLLQVAYFSLLIALFATTVGKRPFRLYVVTVGGSRVSFPRAIVRALAQLLSGALFGVGYLLIAFRADKRGLHDLIAGTVVIRRQ